MFKDQKRFPELVDPLLKCAHPVIGLNQAVGVAAMCLQEEASVRPFMADVVIALSFLTEGPPLSEVSSIPSHLAKPPISEEKTQCHPPQPIQIDTINRSHSNSTHRNSSCHGSSRSNSPRLLQNLLEFNQSSSSLFSKQSSHGNEISHSSSMGSVHSEDSSHQASRNPSSSARQPNNQYHHEFEKNYFQHSWSAQKRSHQ